MTGRGNSWNGLLLMNFRWDISTWKLYKHKDLKSSVSSQPLLLCFHILHLYARESFWNMTFRDVLYFITSFCILVNLRQILLASFAQCIHFVVSWLSCQNVLFLRFYFCPTSIEMFVFCFTNMLNVTFGFVGQCYIQSDFVNILGSFFSDQFHLGLFFLMTFMEPWTQNGIFFFSFFFSR